MTLSGILQSLDQDAVALYGYARDAAAQSATSIQAIRPESSTLLGFARGIGLQAAVLIMVAGLCWRLAGILLLRRRPQHALSRASWFGRVGGGTAMIFTRSFPRRTFLPRIGVSVGLSTVFHVGFFAILLGGAPHILIIHQLTGLIWPDLPKGVVVMISGLTLAAMLALLARRIAHPVMRLLSKPDDYLSWLVVFLPVLTGILLSGETIASYESLLALHILSVELMMIWLPFGKLMHGVLVFASRGAMGFNFARKGAAT
jgi:nitrate reductase gamma subunit